MAEQKLDRRVQRTRQAIREALMALMLEKSYEKVTVQDIIDRANVGRATFYNHYQDKDDLLLRGVAEIAYRHEGSETHHPLPEVQQVDTISTTGMFRHSQQNSMLHQVMFKRTRENPIQEKVTAFLVANIEKNLRQLAGADQISGVPVPILVHFISGGLLALIQWWHEHDFPYTPEEMDGFFQQTVMPGVFEVLGKKQ